MGLTDTIRTFFGASKAVEGEFREGPYYLPNSGGWLSSGAGRLWNWWQAGYDVDSRKSESSMVETCVAAYAQTVAQCPGNHWRWKENDGRTRVMPAVSALGRVLRKPNAYQTSSDFKYNLVRRLLDGNAYALAIRNDRFEVTELHLMNKGAAQIAETGDVFYHLSGNPVIERMIGKKLVVPARDVLHLKLHTPRHPLLGESPLVAAALQMAAGDAALSQQVNYFLNQSRPSFLLSTDQILTAEQVKELRARWEEQSKGLNQGGVPILTAGLKAQPIGGSARDSQLAELLKLSDQAVANVYRVPLAILGMGENKFATTEALMQFWLASGLGFLLNHIEEGYDSLFKLSGQPDEYTEFDTSVLMRSAFADRVKAWSEGVKGGLFPRNAALKDFEMPVVEGGDEVWVQQQDIPLSVALENAKNPPAVIQPPSSDPAPAGNDSPPEEDENGNTVTEASIASSRQFIQGFRREPSLIS